MYKIRVVVEVGMMRFLWSFVGLMVLACSGNIPDEPPPEIPVEIEKVMDDDPCTTPPPHECCQAATPEYSDAERPEAYSGLSRGRR